MIRSNNRFAGMLATAAATALLVTACGGNSSQSTADASKANVVKAEGEGVSLNDFGGAQLALGQPKKGGSLRLGMLAPADTLDPLAALGTSGLNVAASVYGSLFTLTPDGQLAPGLAESIANKDNQHFTIKLRSGLKFSDGTPLDAAAVVDYLDRYRGPSSVARDAGILRSRVTDVKAVDDTTVAVDIKAPSVDFPLVFAGTAGNIPSPTAVKKEGKAFGQHPVGAGPFKVASFQPGGDIVLVRNPGYYDPKLPYLDKLTLVTATDTQARLAALKSGDLDLAPTQSVTDFDDARKAGLTVLEQPAYTYFDIALNHKKPPFDDPQMRKAIAMAIDDKALATAVFEGKQLPMQGFLTSNHPDFVKTDWPTFDPAAAKKIVDAYKAKGGDPSFELTTTSPPEFQRQASVIQQMLKDVGIDMRIDVSDQPTMITAAASGNFTSQLRFLGITLQTGNDIALRFGGQSPANLAFASDPTLDKLIAQVATTPTDQRKELYAQEQQALTEWMPLIPTVQQVGGWIVGKNVAAFPGAHGESTIDQIALREVAAK